MKEILKWAWIRGTPAMDVNLSQRPPSAGTCSLVGVSSRQEEAAGTASRGPPPGSLPHPWPQACRQPSSPARPSSVAECLLCADLLLTPEQKAKRGAPAWPGLPVLGP